MCRERKIFVKAALQLLESHERENFASVVAPAEATEDPRFDLIRSGFLWKGSKAAMGRSGMHARAPGGGGHQWKSKYVELRHGQFSYYDDEADESPLVTTSTHSHHVNFSASKQRGAQYAAARPGGLPVAVGTKKVIPLSSESCVCRIVALDIGEVMSARSPAPFFWQHQHTSSGVGVSAGDSAGPAGTARSAAAVVPAAFTPTSSSGNLEALTAGGGGRDGRCAFEVSVLGGQRRLFLASSAAECEAWVTAINIAMGGKRVAAASVLQDKQEIGEAEDRYSTVSATGSGNLGAEVPAVPLARRNSRGVQPLSSLLGAAAVFGDAIAVGGGVEGAAGPYARSIADYIGWQEHLHSLTDERDFRAAMQAFIGGPVCLSIPVAYVKGKCGDSRFRSAQQCAELSAHGEGGQHAKHGGILAGSRHWLSAGHKKPHHAAVERRPSAVVSRALQKEAVCVEKSQMWKDLQRDEVTVDGERVCGTSGSLLASPPGAAASQDHVGGAEAIVGVLVRHISDAVDAAKSELVRLLQERQECDPSTHPFIDAVQEAQVVQCARNILMMCNRTQSGGDTYYCVDTLLNRARGSGGPGGNDLQNSLFVLAPVSNSADPLEIAVDVVETVRSNFFADDVVDTNGAITYHRGGVARAPPAGPSRSVGADEPPVGTPNDVEHYRPSERVSANSEDFIDAIVASTGALSSASPPAHQPARESEASGRARLEQPGTSDAGASRAALAGSKGGRCAAATAGKVAVASPTTVAPGRGGFARSSSAASNRSGRRFSAVSPQNAKTQDGTVASPANMRKADDEASASAAQQDRESAAELENSAMQRRGSGRRSQLKLCIDDESSNCDNDSSPACTTNASRGELNGRSGSTVGSSVGDACDTTNPGDRDDCDADDEDTAKGLTFGGTGIAFAAISARGVPLSVMCLSDGEEDDGGTPGAAIGSLAYVGPHFGKDDSTVISDITFDTTAGFSQSTTLAQYQRSQVGAVTPVALHRADGGDAVPVYGSIGKHQTAHKPKSLLKMIASRLTPKPGAAAMTPTGVEAMAPSPLQHGASAAHARALNHAASPRFRGGAASTFLAAASSDGAEQHVETHRFGSYFSGGVKKRVHMFSEQRQAAASEAARPGDQHQPALSSDSWGAAGLHDGDASSAAVAPRPCLCVRLQVRGVSRYRVCSADPQGDPEEDNWATMVGTFRQTFLIPACAAGSHQSQDAGGQDGPSAVGAFDRCRLALTDRVVSITAEKFNAGL